MGNCKNSGRVELHAFDGAAATWTRQVYNLFQDLWNWFINLEGGYRFQANRQTGLMVGGCKVPLAPRLSKQNWRHEAPPNTCKNLRKQNSSNLAWFLFWKEKIGHFTNIDYFRHILHIAQFCYIFSTVGGGGESQIFRTDFENSVSRPVFHR